MFVCFLLLVYRHLATEKLSLFKLCFQIGFVADFARGFGQVFYVRCLPAGFQPSHIIYLIYVSSSIVVSSSIISSILLI